MSLIKLFILSIVAFMPWINLSILNLNIASLLSFWCNLYTKFCLLQLNEALEASRNEVAKLHRERELYEETMKKAFMRGVCALNLEAMNMFHEQEGGGGGPGMINI